MDNEWTTTTWKSIVVNIQIKRNEQIKNLKKTIKNWLEIFRVCKKPPNNNLGSSFSL